jgi:hypothetical protein
VESTLTSVHPINPTSSDFQPPCTCSASCIQICERDPELPRGHVEQGGIRDGIVRQAMNEPRLSTLAKCSESVKGYHVVFECSLKGEYGHSHAGGAWGYESFRACPWCAIFVLRHTPWCAILAAQYIHKRALGGGTVTASECMQRHEHVGCCNNHRVSCHVVFECSLFGAPRNL